MQDQRSVKLSWKLRFLDLLILFHIIFWKRFTKRDLIYLETHLSPSLPPFQYLDIVNLHNLLSLEEVSLCKIISSSQTSASQETILFLAIFVRVKAPL